MQTGNTFIQCTAVKPFGENVNVFLQSLFNDKFTLNKSLFLFNTQISDCVKKINYPLIWSLLSITRKTITKNWKSEQTPTMKEFVNMATEV